MSQHVTKFLGQHITESMGAAKKGKQTRTTIIEKIAK